MKRPKKFPVKYEKGIRYVTRKDTTKEAEKAFETFCAYQIRQMLVARYGRSDEELVKKQVRENIDHLKAEGFVDDEYLHFLDLCRNAYISMPRRKPRKKPKKEFDEKGVPKMANTPENLALMRELMRIRRQSLDEKC